MVASSGDRISLPLGADGGIWGPGAGHKEATRSDFLGFCPTHPGCLRVSLKGQGLIIQRVLWQADFGYNSLVSSPQPQLLAEEKEEVEEEGKKEEVKKNGKRRKEEKGEAVVMRIRVLAMFCG